MLYYYGPAPSIRKLYLVPYYVNSCIMMVKLISTELAPLILPDPVISDRSEVT